MMISKSIVRLALGGLLVVVGGMWTAACRAEVDVGEASGQVKNQTVAKVDAKSGSSELKAAVEVEAEEKAKETDIRESAEPRVLEVLDKLEELGQTIRTLQSELSLEKLETLVDDRTFKEGMLYYQREKDKIRFRISFSKTRYGKRSIKDAEDFVLADGWLTHRQGRSKREDSYQITRAGQSSADLMRIGKSPLPIPIGQKTKEVLKNFEVSLIEADEKTDPAKVQTTHLRLVPREGTELAMSHTRLDFWLRKADDVPIRSQWENDSGDIFTADMSKLRINRKIKSRVFKLGKLPSDYERGEPHFLPKEPSEKEKEVH